MALLYTNRDDPIFTQKLSVENVQTNVFAADGLLEPWKNDYGMNSLKLKCKTIDKQESPNRYSKGQLKISSFGYRTNST